MPDDQQSARKPPKRVQFDRYVVSVDRQAKTGYKSQDDAQAEAARITRAYPRVAVAVTDQEGADITEREADAPTPDAEG